MQKFHKVQFCTKFVTFDPEVQFLNAVSRENDYYSFLAHLSLLRWCSGYRNCLNRVNPGPCLSKTLSTLSGDHSECAGGIWGMDGKGVQESIAGVEGGVGNSRGSPLGGGGGSYNQALPNTWQGVYSAGYGHIWELVHDFCHLVVYLL